MQPQLYGFEIPVPSTCALVTNVYAHVKIVNMLYSSDRDSVAAVSSSTSASVIRQVADRKSSSVSIDINDVDVRSTSSSCASSSSASSGTSTSGCCSFQTTADDNGEFRPRFRPQCKQSVSVHGPCPSFVVCMFVWPNVDTIVTNMAWFGLAGRARLDGSTRVGGYIYAYNKCFAYSAS